MPILLQLCTAALPTRSSANTCIHTFVFASSSATHYCQLYLYVNLQFVAHGARSGRHRSRALLCCTCMLAMYISMYKNFVGVTLALNALDIFHSIPFFFALTRILHLFFFRWAPCHIFVIIEFVYEHLCYINGCSRRGNLECEV